MTKIELTIIILSVINIGIISCVAGLLYMIRYQMKKQIEVMKDEIDDPKYLEFLQSFKEQIEGDNI